MYGRHQLVYASLFTILVPLLHGWLRYRFGAPRSTSHLIDAETVVRDSQNHRIRSATPNFSK